MTQTDSPVSAKISTKNLPRKMLSDQVKEYLREAILSGVYAPGARIVESALTAELGVSQAPVREAIRELVVMGFLETEPYKGTTVRTFSEYELYEVYTVRASLESLAARQAAPRLKDEHIAQLQAILDDMRAAAHAGDQDQMVRIDNQFHKKILQIAGNKLLHRLWETLQFGQWTIFTTAHSELGLVFLTERHVPLLEALATRDADKAAEAMRRHIEELGPPIDPDILAAAENGRQASVSER